MKIIDGGYKKSRVFTSYKNLKNCEEIPKFLEKTVVLFIRLLRSSKQARPRDRASFAFYRGILTLGKEKPMPSTTIRYFEYEHLKGIPREVSQMVRGLAHSMESRLPDGPEKSAGMRKLLEAKDCFVRAALEMEDKQ